MALDLSALDDPIGAPGASGVAPVLTPPRAPLEAFEEDPSNPRIEFDDPEFEDFVQDVKEHGILQPLVVVVTPEGRLRIRFGARRLRAAARLALPDVPYVVTEDARQFDDYAQVSENERRKNLQPFELASFIAKRVGAGEKKKAIASKLKIDASAVTHLLSLVDAPAFLLEMYYARKCRSPQYLYELRKLHEQEPELVERRCAEADEIDRKFVSAIAKEVEPRSAVPSASGQAGQKGVLDNIKTDSADPRNRDGGAPKDRPVAVQRDPGHNPDIEREPAAQAHPNTLKRPLLLGTYRDREVMIVLGKRPSRSGLVFIRYEDDSSEDEGVIGDVTLSLLTDSAS